MYHPSTLPGPGSSPAADGRAALAAIQKASMPVDVRALGLPGVFQRIGSLMTGDDLALRLRPFVDSPVSHIARWIAHRKVVNFVWRAQFLLPTFQFESASMQPHPHVSEAIAELADVYDDWDIAAWFARPNSWLAHAAPAQISTDRNADAVVQAARADRFVALG
jgi:hypothetical protein